MQVLPRHSVIFKACPTAAEDGSGTNTPLFTAIPFGEFWQVKAVGRNGETKLLGLFNGRLSALGAATLLAARTGARVAP
jgi:hypothetical protein